MKLFLIISSAIVLNSAALAQVVNPESQTTANLYCAVSSSAPGEKTSNLSEQEIAARKVVHFKDNSVYIALKKTNAGYYEGLIQITTNESGIPVTTNFVEVIKSLRYSANTPSGSFIEVTCSVR